MTVSLQVLVDAEVVAPTNSTWVNANSKWVNGWTVQGLTQTEVIEAGASVNYVWDDLGLPHKLVVTIQGTSGVSLDAVTSFALCSSSWTLLGSRTC